LPRGETHPEVRQGAAEFHHEIADAVLPQLDPGFHDTAALDAALDMLEAQPTVVQGLAGQLLLQGEFLAAGFLGGRGSPPGAACTPGSPDPGGRIYLFGEA